MARRVLAALTALVLVAPGGVSLAADLAGGLAHCAVISDSLHRLTCYDALAKGAGGDTTTTAASERATSQTGAEVGGRCQAITTKGAQCKRSAKAGSRYCYQHGG
jgi:hypothetical protein